MPFEERFFLPAFFFQKPFRFPPGSGSEFVEEAPEFPGTVIQRVIPECALEGGFRHSAGAVGFFLEEACFFTEFPGGAENGDFAVRFEQLLQLLDIFGQQTRPAGGDNENLHVDQRMKILELILLDIDEQFGS